MADGAVPSTLARRSFAWASRNVVQLLALVAAVLYLLLRLPLDEYYRAFGITPEEAGFGTADALLRQSIRAIAISVTAALAYAVLAAALFPGYVLSALRRVDPRAYGRGRLILAWSWSGVVGAGAAMTCFYVLGSARGGVGFQIPWPYIGAGMLSALAVVGVVYAGIGSTSAARRWALDHTSKLSLQLFGSYVLLGLAFATWTSITSAREDADDVHHGVPASTRYVPWKGQRVAVAGIEPRKTLNVPGCVMYLGQSDGHIFLYDIDHSRTLTIPSADVRLTFGANRCRR